jgi:redox-sensitive bicupin YhaK (pirin superfamily)
MNFSDLEVINDDILQPGSMVPEHEHKDMEIFGYVVQGPCTHTDNLGNTCDVPSGAVQRMKSGKGIRHTEGNNSTHPIRYLQMWIKPNKDMLTPSWDWASLPDRTDKFCDLCELLPIDQDTHIFSGIFTKEFNYSLNTQRRYYAYIVSGTGTLNNISYGEGDGFSIENESNLLINPSQTELLLFDLR